VSFLGPLDPTLLGRSLDGDRPFGLLELPVSTMLGTVSLVETLIGVIGVVGWRSGVLPIYIEVGNDFK